MDETTTVQTGIADGEPQQFHPRVNPKNHRVQDLPAALLPGDIIARVDTWTDTETSHWVVREMEPSSADTDAGYRYRVAEVGGDAAMFISHGEVQLLVARGSARVSTGSN